MSVVVQKYGGSSVADAGRIQRVAQRVAKTRGEGHRVVVVVSAMGDTTDELLALARKITANPHRRELDMLLTAGERISMALLSIALHDLGVEAVSFTGSQSGIITDGAHTNARIVEIRPVRILEALEKGRVVIVAGYQGVSREKEVTTLGRGATAVVSLEADVCEICSDVDGVYTADPRVVPGARRLSELSHEEMQELALAGAKVLNAQAVEFARDRGITIHAKSTFLEGSRGTVVRKAAPRELRISGVSVESELLVVRGRSDALEILQRHSAWPRELWFEGREEPASPATDGARTRGALDGALRAIVPLENVHGLPALLGDLRHVAEVDEGLAQVAVVGSGIGAAKEPLDRALSALALAPRAINVTPLRIAFLVPRADAPDCARRLHDELIPR